MHNKKRNPPLANSGGQVVEGDRGVNRSRNETNVSRGRAQQVVAVVAKTASAQLRVRAQQVVAVVAKTASAQLRVSLTTWRGLHKLQLQEATATFRGLYMPSGAPISLGVDKLPQLIAALQAAETEARARGLLPKGRAA